METIATGRTAEAQIEREAIRKISWRLLPLVVAAYCVAYIDRSNVSFARLTMNEDLGLTETIYGLGAGIFFIGYFIFEIPSNLILEKVGARIWIARIMFTWGVISAAAALATGPTSFLVIRFLLGAAEAGFFPGIILYFTYWYPARYRGRVISILFLAQPIANALASAVSGLLLDMDGVLGVRGWQWVFIIEALPAVILSAAVLKIMTDRPMAAKWLSSEEKNWIEGELGRERRLVESGGKLSLWAALKDPRVLILSLIYLTSTTANYGIVFFLPQIVKGLGLTNIQTGLVSAMPWIIGTAGLFLWGWSSDRTQERRWHLIAGVFVGCAGLAFSGWQGSTYAGLAGITIAIIGIYGSRTAFWPMPSLFLTGTAAAAGIALINAIGNLGGQIGPFAVGRIKDLTGSYEMGFYFLAASSFLGGAVAYFFARRPGPPDRSPSRPEY
jgi:MFS transporter, ACS family, tartrate transporter